MHFSAPCARAFSASKKQRARMARCICLLLVCCWFAFVQPSALLAYSSVHAGVKPARSAVLWEAMCDMDVP